MKTISFLIQAGVYFIQELFAAGEDKFFEYIVTGIFLAFVKWWKGKKARLRRQTSSGTGQTHAQPRVKRGWAHKRL